MSASSILIRSWVSCNICSFSFFSSSLSWRSWLSLSSSCWHSSIRSSSRFLSASILLRAFSVSLIASLNFFISNECKSSADCIICLILVSNSFSLAFNPAIFSSNFFIAASHLRLFLRDISFSLLLITWRISRRSLTSLISSLSNCSVWPASTTRVLKCSSIFSKSTCLLWRVAISFNILPFSLWYTSCFSLRFLYKAVSCGSSASSGISIWAIGEPRLCILCSTSLGL